MKEATMFPTPQPVVPSLQARVQPDEWQARLELAACYRVFALLGWTEMIYNHITLRLPDSVTGGEKHFLINPFGLHYSEVTASNLVKIDVQGRVLDGSPYPVNPAGFTVHAAVHEGLAGAHCVMHTHTTAGVAVACVQGGLQQTNFYSAQLHNMVAYHDFEGITIHADEAPRLLRSIGDKQAVILRNHGLLAWGTPWRKPLRCCGPCSAPAKSSWPPSAWASPLPCPRPLPTNAPKTPCSSTRTTARAKTYFNRWCAKSTGKTKGGAHESLYLRRWRHWWLDRDALGAARLQPERGGARRHFEALQQNGLVQLQGDQEIRTSVTHATNPADLGVQDLVIVAVKAPAMADVARRIGPLIGPHTVVLTAMNGVPWWFLQGFGGTLSGTTCNRSTRQA
jgi:ribulose-5-phosphate 4-epimerase/fuculose-1-phosphate aldolase